MIFFFVSVRESHFDRYNSLIGYRKNDYRWKEIYFFSGIDIIKFFKKFKEIETRYDGKNIEGIKQIRI